VWEDGEKKEEREGVSFYLLSAVGRHRGNRNRRRKERRRLCKETGKQACAAAFGRAMQGVWRMMQGQLALRAE
jgi:hypothetical protein